MRQAITLLEKQIEENALEMKIVAFEYIRSTGMTNSSLKQKFIELEQRNIALEQAVDKLLELED